jgi:RNA polymerase sigma-70 factor, ECF subfamily
LGVRVTATEAHLLLSDHELVAEAQAGSSVALERLIGAVRPLVLKYCRSRLATYAGGLDIADDVAQETCVAIMRVLPSYRRLGAAPFTAFVYAIAAHKVADAQRSYSRSAVPVEEVPDQVEPSPTPEERVIAAVDRRLATQLLDRLPVRMREVLVLKASGMSAEVIGQQLDMTANAVRVTQHRASGKLRRLITQSDQAEVFDALLSSERQLAAIG